MSSTDRDVLEALNRIERLLTVLVVLAAALVVTAVPWVFASVLGSRFGQAFVAVVVLTGLVLAVLFPERTAFFG